MNVAVLVDIIKETKANWRFVFEDPLANQINMISGMLVQLCCKPGDEGSVVRNYSVASWQDGTNRFELIITNLEGGAMSDYLFKEAKIGDEFIYRGPMGVFTLPDNLMERDIYMVSTGSGISPFRSMINDIFNSKKEFKNIKLFFGTRKQEDICYWDEMKLIETILPNFEFMEGDIRNLQTCNDVMFEIDYVIHQAALGSVPRSIKDPILTNQVNIDGFWVKVKSTINNREYQGYVFDGYLKK